MVVKIPLVPVLLNLPKHLSKRDRQEILRNKWRDFNVRPEISEMAKTDPLPIEKKENSNPSSMSCLPNMIPSFSDGDGASCLSEESTSFWPKPK